jgi:hypothetical protein
MKEKYSLREASVRCGWEQDEVSCFIEQEYIFPDEDGLIPWDEYQVLWIASGYCDRGFHLHEALRLARQNVREMLFLSDCA